ncbi:MAG: Fur family transcriptional regulator [Candidatus Sericytochromatia bacterium]|nr:Fur family transcriptional regulator [Candidatus Sericytochromatia bacterium]
MAYQAHALSRLKEAGYRITTPRRRVIDLLAEAPAALSAYEIRDQLNDRGEGIDVVSIYRILECLEQNQLVHRVLSSGKYHRCIIETHEPCGLEQQDHCHHNLVCRSCGRVTEMHCPGLGDLLVRAAAAAGYALHDHQLELGGTCGDCAA